MEIKGRKIGAFRSFLILVNVLLFLYFIFLIIEPILYIKTDGEFLDKHKYTKTELEYSSSKYRGYTTNSATYQTTKYQYNYSVNNKLFEGSKLTRMVIYPNYEFKKGLINVYYNRFFPNLSILVPIDYKYLFFNSIPFKILTILNIFINIDIILVIIFVKKRSQAQ